MNKNRELFTLFLLEDVPELAIEIMLVAAFPEQGKFVLWLSTIPTALKFIRHTLVYIVSMRMLELEK